MFVLVRANNSIEVVIEIRRWPPGIVSQGPLFFEVHQRDISLLGVSGVTSRVDSVRGVSGEPILRSVPEQPLPEPDETLPPAPRIIQLLRNGKLLRLVGSLLSGSPPPTHQNNHEDESASESHKEYLPPLESARVALCGGGRVDASDTGQG